MAENTRPSLLQLGEQENFWRYKREFKRLYQSEAMMITDVLGNQVVFPESSCWHVCYKRDETDRLARRPRNIWSQERAERISWILAALTDPRTEVRPNDKDPDNRLNYLLIVEADPENSLPQEYYIVVTEWINKTTVRFTTAYPIDDRDWREYRRAGRALYPRKAERGG